MSARDELRAVLAPDALLGRIALTITDDVDTMYLPSSSSSGGGETTWRADWRFAPGVPDGASRLTVAIGADRLELEL